MSTLHFPTLYRAASWNILAVFLFCASPLFAGMVHEDCREPFIYKDAAVNVVVLPYRYVGESRKQLTETGQRLSMLIQMHSLLHILPYGSVGAVQMEMPRGAENSPACEPDIVWQKLMGKARGAVVTLPPKHGIVMIWGLLYEEGDDIYVKSYARFVRKDSAEEIKFRAGGVEFSAAPSRDVVSFVPQRLERKDLDNIEVGYQKANVVRSSPDESSVGRPFPSFVRPCPTCPMPAPGYYVEEKKGDWLRVRFFDPNLEDENGWIRAGTKIGEQSLDSLMPELQFTQGLAGYLRYRVARDENSEPPPGTVDLALENFEKFRKMSSGSESSSATGESFEFAAILRFLRNQGSDMDRAVRDVQEAAILQPESSAARNLSACVQIWQDWNQGKIGTHAKSQADQLIAATVLDAHSNTNLTNLRGLYQLLLQNAAHLGPQSPFSPDEIRQRINRIDSSTKSDPSR